MDLGDGFERGFGLHGHGALGLRVFVEDLAQFAQWLAALGHEAENLQGGNQSVARRAMTQENHVSALLPAENETSRAHGFEHVAVAHAGADHFAAGLFDGFVQSEIAHHGGDHGVPAQLAAAQQIQSGHGEQFVTIERIAVFVAQQKTVGVAVMGESDLRPGLFDQPADFAGHSAPAVRIDVEPVGCGVENMHVRAEGTQRLRSRLVGGAIGAIDGDLESAQGETRRQGF